MTGLLVTTLALAATSATIPLPSVRAPIDSMGCVPRGDSSPDLRKRAVAACQRARTRLQMLFGDSAAPVTLVFVPRTPDTDMTLGPDTLIFQVPVPSPGGFDDSGFRRWEATAPHEIAHGLQFMRSGTFHTYGPGNGDWFMEAVAIWAESEEDIADRVRQAGGRYGALLKLSGVLGMHHPLHVRPPQRGATITEVRTCRGVCPRGPDSLIVRTFIAVDGTTRVDTLTSSAALLDEQDQGTSFYALSIAALMFIHERGGTAAVRELEDRVRAGAGGNAVVGLPGLPASLDEFTLQWQRWLDAKLDQIGR